MRTIIIWGAGRIGRGFVADIFSQAQGFKIVFVDIDRALVSQLSAARRYTIAAAGSDGINEKVFGAPFEAVHTSDMARLSALFREPQLLLDIAVHEPKLNEVADMLAPLIALRAETGLPMDVMMNVNMHRPDERFNELMLERLSSVAQEYFRSNVGVTGIFAMCISPPTPDWLRAKDSLALWNNGWETQTVSRQAFRCPPPVAPRLYLTDDIAREETRKLYTLNMSHALLSYLGLPLGLKTSYEALKNEKIRPILDGALLEASCGLIHRFGFNESKMAAWREKIIALLDNPYMEDGLQRLGADSRRKLGHSDRLVGPALLALEAGKEPVCLAKAIRAGFAYTNEDEGTRAVRSFYEARGLSAALTEFCGLSESHPLHRLVTGSV